MNQAIDTALKDGDVFSKDYVKTLREEAKATRLKLEAVSETLKKVESGMANADATTAKAVADAVAASTAVARREGEKNLALSQIRGMCETAGVTIDPLQIYQEGMSAEKAFSDYSEKNPTLFKREDMRVHGIDLGAGESARTVLNGTMPEARKDDRSRGMVGKIYQKLVMDDKQRNRLRKE